MSVPVHSIVSTLPVTATTSPPLPVQPDVTVSSPSISNAFTTVVPPTPLPSFVHSPPENPEQSGTDVGFSRVPYPITSSMGAKAATSAVGSSEKAGKSSAEEDIRVAYSYQPGKTYRTKRVFKVIILGDAAVGKTCLSFRFCNGRFPAQTEATIGVDFRERSVVIDGELIRVQLWDTAGQERYRQSIVSHYYRNVNAVVFVYDVSNISSFLSLTDWINECRKHSVSSSNDTPHILIGNKCDLASENRVKTDIAQMFADQNDMALFETSALADSEADHVESIFMTLVHKLQQSKPMHVQSDAERAQKQQRLLLKAGDANKEADEAGWCC